MSSQGQTLVEKSVFILTSNSLPPQDSDMSTQQKAGPRAER